MSFRGRAPIAPVSPISEVSSFREDDLQAVRMQRVDTPTAINVSSPVISPMTPWVREAVAEKKRQLAASRALASPELEIDEEGFPVAPERSRLIEDHFGIPEDGKIDSQRHYVSVWLDGLPERLVEGMETVLRDEVEETFGSGRRRSKMKSRAIEEESIHDEDDRDDEQRQTFFEDLDSQAFDYCPGIDLEEALEEDYSTDDIEDEDDFLVKVLLGRKRLMQAEISMKRLKMGLKHITSGLCTEFSTITDTGRTRDLLAQVDATYEEVVRKRLSNATAIRQKADHNDEQKQRYRRRLKIMREKDPGFILRVYSEREISELKTMVADILGMDEKNGDSEGTDWFWNMLPRLLELRGDMTEAEREMQRQRRAAKVSGKSSHGIKSDHFRALITSSRFES